jgi:outer membrane immunogenic protein
MLVSNGQCFGADLPTKAPPLQPLSNWNGCYVGGNVGAIGDHDYTSVGLSDPVPNNSGLTGLVAAGAIPINFSYDRSSWLAGGQVGCNHQFNNWVVGIETDLDATHLNGAQSLNPASPFAVRYTSGVTQDMNWLGTTRARIGSVWNNVLFYATGGVAYARVSNTYFNTDVPSTGIISIAAADSTTQVGWTLGGGLEVDLGRWSLKGEALWYSLGNHTLTAPCALVGGGTCSTPNAAFLPNYQNRGAIARVGLNYHFNIGPVATAH